MARYTDIDLNFISHPVKKDILKKTDADAVKQSIKNLVFLNFYEKPFNPDIGSNVGLMLFELANPMTSINIANAIRQVITNYEPRAELRDVSAIADTSGNGYEISVRFNVKNVPAPVSFNFFLDRIR